MIPSYSIQCPDGYIAKLCSESSEEAVKWCLKHKPRWTLEPADPYLVEFIPEQLELI